MSAAFLDQAVAWGAQGQALQELLDDVLGPDVACIEDVVKSDARAIVARGMFDGHAAFFKRFLRFKDIANLGRTEKELRFLGQRLNTGAHRVMPVIKSLPETGILITGAVPGRKLSRLLAEADSAKRARLLDGAAAWLEAVVALRPERRALDTQKRLAKLKAPGTQAAPEVVNALRRLREALEYWALALGAPEVCHGLGHGDFTQQNVLFDSEIMWGIDIQGRHKMPVLHMAARFCLGNDVWRRPQDLAAFRPQRFDCGGTFAPVFRFALGWEMHRRYALPGYARKADIVNADITHFLSDWRVPE